MNISELARECSEFPDCFKPTAEFAAFLERFAALIREAVVQELVVGSGEPQIIGVAGFCDDGVGYTADQLAAAVLREKQKWQKYLLDNFGLETE